MKKLMRCAAGKLMRDTATGKLQVYNQCPMGGDCEFCNPGETPKYITLSIDNLVDCIGYCFRWEGADNHWSTYGVAAVLNGCVIILEQDGLAPCVWEKTFTDGDWGTLVYHSGADCTGDESFYPMDELYFRVHKTAVNKLTIGIGLRAKIITDYFNYTFDYQDEFGEGKVAEINDCINVTNLSNVRVCGESGVCCHEGTVSIVEGIGVHYAPPSSQWQTRYSTGDSAVQWSRSVGSSNYPLVDDTVGEPDDDATYTFTAEGTYKDLFSHTPFTIIAGSIITSVKVIGRFKRMVAGGEYLIRELLKVGGVTYNGTSQQLLVGAYFDKEHVWTVNPATGLAWTIDDVNGIGPNPLQTFGYECMGFQKTVRCTQVYIKVDYEYIW